MHNQSLAIAIPTLGRIDLLIENLNKLLPELRENSIPVFITDNAGMGKGYQNVIEQAIGYPFIYYQANLENIGYENNFLKVIQQPTQAYIWPLGDGVFIEKGTVTKLLGIINQSNFDMIGLDTVGKGTTITSKFYENSVDLFIDLYWHLTLTSATIYSNRIIKYIPQIDFNKFKNFPQNGLIFSVMADYNANFFWTGWKVVAPNPNKKSYWMNNVFETFLVDWVNSIENLPSIYEPYKNEVKKSHSKNSRLFSIYNILKFRKSKALNYNAYKTYLTHMKQATDKNLFFLLIISLTPIMIVSILLFGAEMLKRIRNNFKKRRLINKT